MSYSRQRRRILSPATRLQGVTPPPTPVGPIDPRLMMSSGLRDTMRAEEDAYNQRDQDQAYLAQQQAREQERADKAAEAAQKKAEAQSQKMSAYAKSKEYDAAGIYSEKDALGNVVAKKDAMTGKTDYRDMQAPVQYPETGKPYQMKRGEDGKMKQEFPDAKAAFGNNPNDPTDPAIYRMNKAAPWDRIDPQEGLLSPEPEVKRESSRRLLDDERKALQRESEGLGIEMRNPDNKLPSPEKLAEMRARAGSEYADPKEAETLKRADERDAKLRRQNEIATRNLALETTSPDDYAAERLAKLDPNTVQAKRADLMKQKSAGIDAIKAKFEEEQAALQADYQAFLPQTQGFRADQEAGIREKMGQFRLRKQMLDAKRQSLEQSVTEFNAWGKEIHQQATAAFKAKAEEPLSAAIAKLPDTPKVAPDKDLQGPPAPISWAEAVKQERAAIAGMEADPSMPSIAAVRKKWQTIREELAPNAQLTEDQQQMVADTRLEEAKELEAAMKQDAQRAEAERSKAAEAYRVSTTAGLEEFPYMDDQGNYDPANKAINDAKANEHAKANFLHSHSDKLSNYAPWGELTINPTLFFKDDAYKGAVDGATAPAHAKQNAMAQLPALQQGLAAPVFEAFLTAGGTNGAFRESLQNTIGKLGSYRPLPNRGLGGSDMAAITAGWSAEDKVQAVKDFMASPDYSPNWNQVALGASGGADAIQQQYYGMKAYFGIDQAGSQKAGEEEMRQQEVQGAARQTSGGSQPLGALTQGAMSLIPSIAAGVASGGAMALVGGSAAAVSSAALVGGSIGAGMQSAGSTMIEATKGIARQEANARSINGVDPTPGAPISNAGLVEARVLSTVSGAITATLTRLGGATGSEAIFGAMFGGATKAAVLPAVQRTFVQKVIKGAGDFTYHGAREAFMEELPDQALQNVLAQNTFNPDRDLSEGLWETTWVSFLLGGGMNAVTQGAGAIKEKFNGAKLTEKYAQAVTLGQGVAMAQSPDIITDALAGSPLEARTPAILSTLAEIDARIVDGMAELNKATTPAAKLYSNKQLAFAYAEREAAVVALKKELNAARLTAAMEEIDAALPPEEEAAPGMSTLPTANEKAFAEDKRRAKGLIKIAAGQEQSLDEDELNLLGLARDDKGKLIEATFTSDASGVTIRSGSRVKIEDGNLVIRQGTIDRMVALFPKTEPLIGKSEAQRRAEIQAQAAAAEAAKAAPATGTAPDPNAASPAATPAASPTTAPAPAATTASAAAPAAGMQTFAVEVEGMADPVIMDAANVEQAKDMAFAAYPGKIIRSVKATGPAPTSNAAPAAKDSSTVDFKESEQSLKDKLNNPGKPTTAPALEEQTTYTDAADLIQQTKARTADGWKLTSNMSMQVGGKTTNTARWSKPAEPAAQTDTAAPEAAPAAPSVESDAPPTNSDGQLLPFRKPSKKGNIVTRKDGMRGDIISESDGMLSIEWRDGTTSEIAESDLKSRSKETQFSEGNNVKVSVGGVGTWQTITVTAYDEDGKSRIIYESRKIEKVSDETFQREVLRANEVAKNYAQANNLAGYRSTNGTRISVPKLQAAPAAEAAPAVPQNKTPAPDTAAPDVTPAGITKALAATVKGKPSKKQAKRFVVAGQAISKEIARWKAAFPGGISLVTGTPSSGVLMGRKKLELLLDMPRLAESIEALGDNPLGWVEDAMIEEAIHAVVEKLVQEGKLDLMGIWNEIPAETKATTLKAYTSNSDPENQAHEYFRLWLQHRLQQAKGGKGNPAFTEANFPAKAYALLKDALNTLLDYFRDMAGTLRKQGASEDTIGRVMASGDLIEAMVRALDAEAKAAPVAAPAAPEVNDKAGSDASVDPNAVVGTFTTAKGSTYKIYGDGTTERNKAARDDVGHEGDSGAKPRTVRTIYVAGDASSLSAAGLTLPNPEKGARVIIKDGKASMLTWNDAAGQWGVAPESRDIAFFDEPAVGRSPLELWRPKTDVQGYEAYSGMHAGNKITKITPATNEQNNQAALTPEEQTLKDLLSGVIDGTIQSQPIVAPYSRDIPESIFVTVLSTVRGMVNKGIDTPEKLGASLTKMGPAFRQFSEAIWSGMGMTSSALRAITPNWDAIYTALDKPAAAASPEPAPAAKPPVDDRVFDADYTGPRWTYGMRNRPVGIGAAPKGYIIGSGGPAVGRARNGTIQYPRKLTSQELYDFEMELMEQPETPAASITPENREALKQVAKMFNPDGNGTQEGRGYATQILDGLRIIDAGEMAGGMERLRGVATNARLQYPSAANALDDTLNKMEGAANAESEEAAPDPIRDLILSDESRLKKAMAMKKLSVERGETVKQTQEYIESRLVQIADEIARGDGTPEEKYTELVRIYDQQPLFSSRTSTSMENQAYSTPIPMAYVLGHMTGVTPQTSVYDGTAGNGVLAIGADLENSVANEIDSTRRQGLESMGIGTITDKDATLAGAFPSNHAKVDVVHLNPPFGTIPNVNYQGYGMRKLEHIITVRALEEAMKANGTAAIIMGATMNSQEQSKGAQWVFENYLYGNYNVVDNFEVTGDLYGNQGAKWPVRILVLAGKRTNPVKAELAPKTVDRLNTWPEVWERAQRTRYEVERQRQTLGTEGQSPVSPDSPEGATQPENEGAIPGGKRGSSGKAPKRGRSGGNRPGKPDSAKQPGVGSPAVAPPGLVQQPQDSTPASEPPVGGGKPAPRVEGGSGGRPDGSGGRPGDSTRGDGATGSGNGTPQNAGGLTPAQIRLKALAARLDSGGNISSAPIEQAYSRDIPRSEAAELRDIAESLLFDDGIDTPALLAETLQALGLQNLSENVWSGIRALKASLPATVDWSGTYRSLKPNKPPEKPDAPRKKATATETQIPYDPESNGAPFETLIPRGIGEAVRAALEEITANRGPIDEYVAGELDMSVEDLLKAMSAEQVDGVAMAIYQMETGGALIIGDETGIGKGRQAASLIRYAVRKGKIPVFFTKDPKLFSDMWGDLQDINTPMSGPNASATDLSVRPLIFGAQDTARIVTPEGALVLKPATLPQQRNIFARARTDGFAQQGYNAIFTTYSQIRKENDRQAFLEWLAENDDVVIVLDEAHEAAGNADSSMQAAFMMGGTVTKGSGPEKVETTKSGLLNGKGAMHPRGGALYLSATFAKRPDNMPVYFRTDLRKAGEGIGQVVDAMSNGGVALQQAVTEALAEAGQYIRRERDFTGVSYSMKRVQVDDEADLVRQVDEVTEVLSAISNFSSTISASVAASTALSDNQQAMTEFASIVHNQVGQLLLAAKADAVVAEVLAAKERGEKPIVALMNTMESFLSQYIGDMEINVGDAVQLSWSELLQYALSRTLRVSEKMPDGSTQISTVDPEEFGLGGYYQRVMDSAKDIQVTFPVSPIDYIIQKAELAGVKMGELTGRQSGIQYTDFTTGAGTYKTFKKANKNTLVNGFNGGALDAMLLNASGSTGLSIHASEKFKDQQPRHMIIAQPALDINVFIQTLGRIKRTGIVMKGQYPDGSTYGARYSHLTLPLNAELRPAVMAARKMKSLNANTTGESDSAVKIEAEDLMNRFGNRAVAEYLNRNPELASALNLEIDENKDGEVTVPAEVARQFTGRMSLRPDAEQGAAYAEIIADYRRAIEQAKVTGDYDLEIIVHDDWDGVQLNAGEQIITGTDESSILTASVYVQPWEITDNRPTPSGAEMLREFQKENGSVDAAQTKWEQFAKKVDDRLNKMVADQTQNLADAAEMLAEMQEDDAGYKGQQFTVNQLTRNLATTNKKMEIWGATKLRMDEIIDRVGQVVQIEQTETNELDQGMLTQIKYPDLSKGLRIAPSAFKFTYLLDRPGGRIYPSLAQFRPKGYSQSSSNYTIDELKGDRGGKRQTRTIIVGNPVRAYAATGGKGKVVRFKSRDGELVTGLMMPRNWRIKQLVDDPRMELTGGASVARYFANMGYSNGYLESGENIRLQKGGFYKISAPVSRRTGKAIFFDKRLIELAGEFTKTGNRMVATFYDAANIAMIADRITEITGKRLRGQDMSLVQKANGVDADGSNATGSKRRPKSAVKEAATKAWTDYIEGSDSTGIQSQPVDALSALSDDAPISDIAKADPAAMRRLMEAHTEGQTFSEWKRILKKITPRLERFADTIWKNLRNLTVAIVVAATATTTSNVNGVSLREVKSLSPENLRAVAAVTPTQDFFTMPPSLFDEAGIGPVQVAQQPKAKAPALPAARPANLQQRTNSETAGYEVAQAVFLPKDIQQQWLEDGFSTKALTVAAEFMGQKEGQNAILAKIFNHYGITESQDAYPWCATFTSFALTKGGRPAKIFNARGFMEVGTAVKTPVRGDVVVMWNENPKTGGKTGWGGHVGLYLGETPTHVIAISGNAGDEVNVSAFHKERVLGIRRVAPKTATIQSQSPADLLKQARELKKRYPQSAMAILHSDSPILPRPAKKKKNPEVGAQLQGVAIEKWGRKITSDDITPEEEAEITNIGVEEFIAAYNSSGKTASDWYSIAIEAAMEVARVLHPELLDPAIAAKSRGFKDAEDPVQAAQLAMRIALAITSQNLSVELNTRHAEEQFEIFKTTGAFDASRKYGEKAMSISGNLDLANRLISKLGFRAAEAFIRGEFTVKELSNAATKALGRKVNVTGKMDDAVNGAAIFGPKIGQGFLQNILGEFWPVTIDLWLRRTWGRWTGDVIGRGVDGERLARFLDAARKDGIDLGPIKNIRAVDDLRKNGTSKFRTVNAAVQGRIENDDVFVAQIFDVAKKVNAEGQKQYKLTTQPVTPAVKQKVENGSIAYKEFIRSQIRVGERIDAAFKVRKDKTQDKEKFAKEWYAKNGFTAKIAEPGALKPDWSKAANVIVKSVGPIDVPGPQDRRVITRIVQNIQKELTRRGYQTTNADVQAVLWYPEKDLWAKLRGEDESNLKSSYDEEFIKLAEQRGLGNEAKRVAAAVVKRRSRGTSRTGSPDVTQPDGRVLGRVDQNKQAKERQSIQSQSPADLLAQAQNARIAELQRSIDAKYESGKLRGIGDLEAELEGLLDRAESDREALDESDPADFEIDSGDVASPDAASFLIEALTRWNKEDAGNYSTFGAFARRLTGDNEYVIDAGATDAEIEEAAKDATAEYERRRAAMRNVRMMGITDVVQAIRDGNTDTPLRAVNQVIEDAAALRERVRAESERRAQPRQTGKPAIMDQIVRGMKSGKLDAPTAKTIIRFINGLADSTVEDTALSMRSGKGTSSFDFGEALTTLFFNQSNDAAQTAIHEFWHGLSRFLPTQEVAKMRKDYQSALAKYLVKNPGFFALVGRYALLPDQFEDYSRMATPTELAQLQGYNAKGAKVNNFAPDADHYKISFTKENYRYVMLDEWIAETMADRVMADQPVTEGFMGQMVAIFRKFWSAMKVALGRDPYERFRQAVMGPDARQQMWRNTPVEKARALWQSDKVATPFNQRFSAIQSQSPAGPFDGDLFSDNPQSPVNQPINSHEYTPIDISGRLSEIQGGAIGAFPGAVAAVAPPDNLAGVVRRFGNETGVGVWFFRIAGPVGEAQTGGFVQPDHPEWIFLNATSPATASSILAHEWWHSAEKDSAKTKLLEFFAAQVSRLAEPAALDAARKLLAESYEGPFVAVELAANVFSDALTGQSQWGSEVLFSGNWPAVQKLARTLWTKANPLKTSGLKEDADEAIYSQSPADLLAQANASRHSALEAKHNAGTITPAETAQAQALVDEAAKAAGMMEVFHGGDIQGNVIDTSRRERGAISERRDGTFYMSTNPKVAETYPGANNRLFVRINNPFTISTPQKRPASWAGKTAVNRTKQRKSSLSIGEAVDRAKANAYDGVIYGNIVDVGRNYQNGKPADVVGSTVVAFDPNQIKSADPFTGVPLDQRFNTASNSILQSQSPADLLRQANVSMAEVDALAATASAESDGDRTIGDPTRAGGAGTGVESDLNDVMLAASNIYADDIKEMAPQKLADLDAVVRGAMEADPEGNLTRLIRDGMRGVPGNAFDVRMRQMLKEWLARQPATQERREQAAALTMGDHLAKRTASQILGASRDMWVTKAERFRAFMMDHIYTPPPGTRYKILNAPTEEEREALLKKDQERIQRIIDALAKMGVTIEDVLNGGRKLLARRGEMNRTTLKDMDVKKMAAAMDTMDATQSFKDIAAKNGMTVEQVKAAKAEAMAKVMEELRNRRKMAQRAQGIISSQPVTDDPWVTMDFENMAKMSDADAEVEMERIMKELGWFADAQQGKRRTTKRRVPKTPPAGDGSAKGPRKSIPQPELELETVSIFHGMDIGNQVDVVRMKHIVDTASGSSLDVLREIYINWLLSGPVTQATNIVGNVAFGIWNTVLVRAGESTVNAMTGNNLKDSASFGEFIHIFRASVPGMIRGAKMAKMAWGAEHDFFETMGMGDAVGMGGSGLEQLGGRKAISGGKGRVVRMPGRSLMAADSGLKTFFGTMEVAAHAYRLTRKAGIAPGTKAFDDSMNRMMYMAGSPAWDAAVKQAEYNAFQQELNEAKNPVDGIPMWLMELSKSENWVKKTIGTVFFPFVKTPYNIAKTATVNSPLGTAYLMYLVGKGGLAAFKGGKLTFAGEPEFVTTVARQILAWAAYFALQAISEGDEDDDKKKFLITGSSPKNRGEADLQKRALGGAYMARLGGVSFNYGRLEPFATVVASTVDALRSIKRGDSSPEVVTNVVTSLMYQARNKTFLTGLASIGDMLEGRTYGKEYTEILREKVISSIIPNLIKQPMRNWADTEMDTSDAPWWHSALPLPSAVGTKLDPATGEEKLRTGNSMTRMLIPSASVPDKKLTLSDKVLLEWNRLRQNDGSNDEEGNPGKAWAPKLPSPTRKLPNQQDIELNEFARNYLVKRRAVLAQKALAGMPLKPDQTSIDLIKKAYSDGSSQAWNEIKYRPSASLGTIKK